MVVTQDDLPEGSFYLACVNLSTMSYLALSNYKPFIEALDDKDKAARTQ